MLPTFGNVSPEVPAAFPGSIGGSEVTIPYLSELPSSLRASGSPCCAHAARRSSWLSATSSGRGNIRVKRQHMATRPVDFRRGLDGLAAAVQEIVGLDPFCGAAFVFRAKRADRIKILVWDRTGLVLVHKRLEGSKFVWPQVRDGVMRMKSRNANPTRTFLLEIWYVSRI